MTQLDPKALEAAARDAYIAHHRNGPTEEAFVEPNMGRGGFKTEVVVWNAVAQAAVSAYLAAMREAGFVMVPVEPTEDMIDAGFDHHPKHLEVKLGRPPTPEEDMAGQWSAMLAARPQNREA